MTSHESKLSHTRNYHKNNSHLDDTVWKFITALEYKGMNEPTNWSLHIFLTLKRRAGQLNGLVHKFPGRGRPHRARAPQRHPPGSDSMARCQACRTPGRGVTPTPDGAGRRALPRTPPPHRTPPSNEYWRWEGGKNTSVGNVTQQLELLVILKEAQDATRRVGFLLQVLRKLNAAQD